MNKERSVLISGYYGFDNSGDDAILQAIVKDLKSKDNNIDITVLSRNPERTKDIYNVNAVQRFNLGEVIDAIRKTSVLISGGGSLLQDVTSTRSLLYYLAVMILGKLFKKTTIVYANGIGPINKSYNRLLTRMILNKVDLITLRDEDSRRYIDNLHVKNKNVHVTADPVFTLEPSSPDRIKEIFLDEEIPMDSNIIGISLRTWQKAENLKEVMIKTIEHITKEYNVNVLLIPMHYPSDLDICYDIQRELQNENTYILKGKYSVEDIMGVIKETQMIVAMRLHAIIYAANMGVPMYGLVYDPKIEGILNDIGMEYMSDVERLDYEKVIEDIDKIYIHRVNIKDDLLDTSTTMKEKALKNIDLVNELLG